MKATKTSKETKVLELVSRRLRRVTLEGVKLDVLDGEIEKRNGCWHIPVRASARPPSMFDYYGVLADVEMDLSEKHHLDVWLVATVPD